jgi:haloalkane dehalogenase
MRCLPVDPTLDAPLPDFPWAPRRVAVGEGLLMACIDEGPRDAPPVLMLHGEPSWSYLWRHMIPPVRAGGLRVVAPDLIGFGRSSRPAAREAYSYAAHVGWVRAFVEALDLSDITLVCQDWGSLIGLRVAAEIPDRFGRILLSNGGLPTGDNPVPRAFHIWRAFSRLSPWFPIARIIQAGTRRRLSAAELAAYDAPFPVDASKVAARIFPGFVPVSPDNPASAANRQAWEVFRTWEKPFITCFSDGDPITRGGAAPWLAAVPGTRGQPHMTLSGGHFIQEDDPARFAALVLAANGCGPVPA